MDYNLYSRIELVDEREHQKLLMKPTFIYIYDPSIPAYIAVVASRK